MTFSKAITKVNGRPLLGANGHLIYDCLGLQSKRQDLSQFEWNLRIGILIKTATRPLRAGTMPEILMNCS